MKKVNIAIMGMGTVGGGTYRIIEQNRASIAASAGVELHVKRVLELNRDRCHALGIEDDRIARNVDEIATDPEIVTVVETMGGVEPARSFMLACMRGGKNVVTANKECIAKHWSELDACARENGVGFYFEASCVGGVPIIRTLTEGMQANNVREMMGIYNGTTNYILTKMSSEGSSYGDALREAQRLGYAEADPTSDVEGYDSMYKLSILSSLAFNTRIPYTEIYREGITAITASDIAYGKELGYAIKLLAICKRNGNTVELRVHPAFVPASHPLASVNDSFNAVFLKGDAVGDLMLYGRGAGDLPTGSAIVSDVVYASTCATPRYPSFDNNGTLSPEITVDRNFRSQYYFLADCDDKPGMLAKVTSILGAYDVSVDSVIQRSRHDGVATVVFLTHECHENDVRAALDELKGTVEIKSFIRVVS